MSSKKKVVVAMSGGVDSSVAAAELIKKGFEVYGVTLRMRSGVTGSDDKAIADAKDVAKLLGIQHDVIDVREDFEKCVLNYFIVEYANGKTPNPCVKCNPEVKFKRLIEYANEIADIGYVATGHYARVDIDPATGKYRLLRALNKSKDQSYALYRLKQEQLARILFPLGGMTKSEVRELARELGLAVSDKDESQDVCFVPDGRYGDLLKKIAPELNRPGDIVDTNGRVVGEHRGIVFYTIGQRRGLSYAAGRRVYVIDIDPKNNRITVGSDDELRRKVVVVKDLSIISENKIKESVVVSAKIRYNTQDSTAIMKQLNNDWAELIFDHDQRAVTPGQSVVVFDGDVVIGGGIIASDEEIKKAGLT